MLSWTFRLDIKQVLYSNQIKGNKIKPEEYGQYTPKAKKKNQEWNLDKDDHVDHRGHTESGINCEKSNKPKGGLLQLWKEMLFTSSA